MFWILLVWNQQSRHWSLSQWQIKTQIKILLSIMTPVKMKSRREKKILMRVLIKYSSGQNHHQSNSIITPLTIRASKKKTNTNNCVHYLNLVQLQVRVVIITVLLVLLNKISNLLTSSLTSRCTSSRMEQNPIYSHLLLV